MSVPTASHPRDPATVSNAHISRDTARAVEHLSRLERGDELADFGVQPAMFAKFSLFPLSRPELDSAGRWVHSNQYGTVVIRPGDREPYRDDALERSSSRGVAVRGAGNAISEPGSRVLPVPHGGLPRLLMVDIATEARRIAAAGGDASRIDLSATLNAYATQRLGVAKGSRSRAVWKQMEALLKATITFSAHRTYPDGKKQVWQRLHVADELHLWVPGEGTPLAGFEPYIRLSRPFMDLLTGEQVHPVRRDLLAKLAGKPMAMDILTWLGGITWRLHVANRGYADFTWDDLYNTFTHDYRRNDFQKKWVASLSQALAYYPDAKVDAKVKDPSDGRRTLLRVHRSPLLIDERS